MKTADNSLEIGATLENRYHIENILGIGGFGITYKAHDDTLDCTVVIKEYLPEECGARDGDSTSVIPRTNREDDYQYGLEKYLEEARVLAKFKNPNIVKVTNFIKGNGTAYIIMDFEDGIALDEWLKKKSGDVDEKTILQIIVPLLKGLAEVHKAGLLHRDIKPGNIFLRKKGGPLLIDFGAARQALGEQSKSISAIISMGYAPPEQYTTRGKQGPYTDLYAVGAVLYKLIVGETPIDSVDRSHEVADDEPDPLTPCVEAGKGKVSDWLCQLTDHLLQLRPKNRPQTADEALEAIQNKTAFNSAEKAGEPQDSKTRVVKSSERFNKKAESSNSQSAPKPEKDKSKTPLGKIVATIVLVVALGGAVFAWQNNLFGGLGDGQAILYVDTQPDGAEVFLGEYKIGSTPYQSNSLPAGPYQLKIIHPDFKDEIKSLRLADNVIMKEQLTLTPATGGLSVLSEPAGAAIYIDGENTHQVTPTTLSNIKAGNRSLKLHKDKYYDIEAVVSVIKDQTRRSEHALKGGNLMKYEGEWISPEKHKSKLAERKRKKEAAVLAAEIAKTKAVALAKEKAKLAEKAKEKARAQAKKKALARLRSIVKREYKQGNFVDLSAEHVQLIKVNQTEEASRGRAGADGTTGGSARAGSALDSSIAGGSGRSGRNGGLGRHGGRGEAGAKGADVNINIYQAKLASDSMKGKAYVIGTINQEEIRYQINTNRALRIEANGMPGAEGGNGGNGGNGGHGSTGRKGRNATAYASGGNGGRGGNGGSGGKAGNGGRGGNGGNGGEVIITVSGDTSFEKNIKLITLTDGGKGGRGGDGGIGGEGGVGGAGGPGGNSYSGGGSYNPPGLSGSRGASGRAGSRGSRGTDGMDGRKGSVRIIKSSVN